LASSS
jgi:hypothetical protein